MTVDDAFSVLLNLMSFFAGGMAGALVASMVCAHGHAQAVAEGIRRGYALAKRHCTACSVPQREEA